MCDDYDYDYDDGCYGDEYPDYCDPEEREAYWEWYNRAMERDD